MTDLIPASTWDIEVGDEHHELVAEYIRQGQRNQPEKLGYAVDHQISRIAEDAMYVEKTATGQSIAHTEIVDVGVMDTNGIGILTLLRFLYLNDNNPPSTLEWRAPYVNEMSFRKIDTLPVLDFFAPFDEKYGIDWQQASIDKKVVSPEILHYTNPDIMEKLQSLLGFTALFVAETENRTLEEASRKIDEPQRVTTAFANFASVVAAQHSIKTVTPLAYRNANPNNEGQVIPTFSHLPIGHHGLGGMARVFVSRPVTKPASSINMQAISYHLSNEQPLFNEKGAKMLAKYLNNHS